MLLIKNNNLFTLSKLFSGTSPFLLYNKPASKSYKFISTRLYASEKQIKNGEIVTINSVHPLWHCILVVVDTTVPLANSQVKKQTDEMTSNFPNEDDTLGPVGIEYFKAAIFPFRID